jgi:hypothetical protein
MGVHTAPQRKRRQMSAAARRAVSQRMKGRWEKRKVAAGKVNAQGVAQRTAPERHGAACAPYWLHRADRRETVAAGRGHACPITGALEPT